MKKFYFIFIFILFNAYLLADNLHPIIAINNNIEIEKINKLKDIINNKYITLASLNTDISILINNMSNDLQIDMSEIAILQNDLDIIKIKYEKLIKTKFTNSHKINYQALKKYYNQDLKPLNDELDIKINTLKSHLQLQKEFLEKN